MTEKMVKYARDQLIHSIYHDNDTTTVHFMYFPHHKLEANQVLNGLICIIYEDLIVNHNSYITRSGIYQATMGIWDKYKRTLNDPNEIHNEEAMEGMF